MSAHNATTNEHIIPVKTNLLVFAGLIVLLIATVVAAQFDLGVFNVAIALTIAVAKALLIILYFMHVRFSGRLAWVFAASGFIWLAILIGLTLSDYISRGWFDVPPPPLG
jgi:cytochrome c oxidase subunit 4